MRSWASRLSHGLAGKGEEIRWTAGGEVQGQAAAVLAREGDGPRRRMRRSGGRWRDALACLALSLALCARNTNGPPGDPAFMTKV